jgi:glycosyltransferase involved in cell wall biosynthesis
VRIAIDATSIPPSPAGAGVYAIELVRALVQRQPRNDGYAVFTRGDWFDGATRSRRDWRIERVTASSRQARTMWEQLKLPAELTRLGADVLHSTHHTLPLRGVRAARVVTVHDVTFFRIPERYPPARRMYMQASTRLSARVADAVIVPSRAVRDDVLRWLNVPERRVYVVYEAAGLDYVPQPREAARAVADTYVDGPYVLSVGSLEPGKNRARLIRAMHDLRNDGIEHRLLVVGQPAWSYESDFQLVRELGMEGHVRFAGYVPREHMPSLYSAASVFALPALYEGFGLPVIEAMACGSPVLTSNVSATAEVAGDAALLVDPHSVSAIRNALRALLTDEVLRARLSRQGIARASGFSWARAAEETHAVYDRAATGRRR